MKEAISIQGRWIDPTKVVAVYPMNQDLELIADNHRIHDFGDRQFEVVGIVLKSGALVAIAFENSELSDYEHAENIVRAIANREGYFYDAPVSDETEEAINDAFISGSIPITDIVVNEPDGATLEEALDVFFEEIQKQEDGLPTAAELLDAFERSQREGLPEVEDGGGDPNARWTISDAELRSMLESARDNALTAPRHTTKATLDLIVSEILQETGGTSPSSYNTAYKLAQRLGYVVEGL